VLVLFSYTACAALLAVLWASDQDFAAKGFLRVDLLLASVGLLLAFSWMSQATRDYAIDCSGFQADERQLLVRDAAYRSAYLWFSGIIVSGIIVSGISYARVASSKRLGPYLWMPTSDTEWQLICGSLVFLAASLPQALIAWREPDVPEEMAVDSAV